MVGPLDAPEAESLVVTLQLAPAGQVKGVIALACDQRVDDGAADAVASALLYHRHRGQLTATVAMCLDLADTDDRAALLNDEEIGPFEVHGIDAGIANHASDRGLVPRGCRPDGVGHPCGQ